jgi:hypothetical protein
MAALRFTLLADGPTDDSLLPALEWVLMQAGVARAIAPQWADFEYVRKPPRGLESRILQAVDLYKCDVLFVHRDAEAQQPGRRFEEIRCAASYLGSESPCVIPVVPVRMTEAWLLFHEASIRQAAGNPNGSTPLGLPPLSKLEKLPDPKKDLHEALREASGLSGRRRKAFDARRAARGVAQLIDDFSPLRSLSAFKALESEVARMVREQHWDR